MNFRGLTLNSFYVHLISFVTKKAHLTVDRQKCLGGSHEKLIQFSQTELVLSKKCLASDRSVSNKWMRKIAQKGASIVNYKKAN